MSPERVNLVFDQFIRERTDLTDNEKKLLDFMRELVLKLVSFMTISMENGLNPLIFRHVGDMIFPEISFRFCYDVIIVSVNKGKGFNITLEDTKNPLESYVMQVRSLLVRG